MANATKSSKPKAATSRKGVKLSALYVKAGNGDATKGGKLVRAKLRSKADKAGSATAKLLKSHGKTNRDGNRWPDVIPVAVVREIGMSK